MPDNTIFKGAEMEQLISSVLNLYKNYFSNIPPLIFRNFVLSLAFLKYVTDISDKQKRKESNQPSLAIFNTNKSADINTLNIYLKKTYNQCELSVGSQIDSALQKLEHSNPDKLKGLFNFIHFDHYFDLDEHSNQSLMVLFDFIIKKKFKPHENEFYDGIDIAEFFDGLFEAFAKQFGHNIDTYYAPPMISKLIATLMNPTIDDSIYDPYCGSGSLLTACSQSLYKNNR